MTKKLASALLLVLLLLTPDVRAGETAATKELRKNGIRVDEIKSRSLGGVVVEFSTRHNDSFLDSLCEINHLVWLVLSNSNVTNDGMSVVAQLPELEVLELDGTSVGDEGVSRLAAMRHLVELDMRDCRAVSDKSIPFITKITTLKLLDLRGTAITPEGVARLEKTFHNSRIRHDGNPWSYHMGELRLPLLLASGMPPVRTLFAHSARELFFL